MDKSNLEKLVVEERNEELKAILQNNEPSKLVDDYEMTLLHLAAKHNNLELIRYLLSVGFDVNARNVDGNTLLASASFSYHFEAVKILLQSNVQIFGVNSVGTSTIELLMRKIGNLPEAIDDARGIPIGKPLRDKIISKNNSTFEKCLKQVEEFKTHEIFDSVTLFTVLTAKSEDLARRLRGEDCFSKLEDYCKKREIHHHYDSTLKFKLNRALKMNLAKSNFAKIVSQKTGIMIGFDHLVIDKVFSFLTYYDLLQLV